MSVGLLRAVVFISNTMAVKNGKMVARNVSS